MVPFYNLWKDKKPRGEMGKSLWMLIYYYVVLGFESTAWICCEQLQSKFTIIFYFACITKYLSITIYLKEFDVTMTMGL